MDALIAQLEAADKGSRGLDGRIYLLDHPDTECVVIVRNGDVVTDEHVPFFTTSLDAALTLVPEGASSWELDHLGHSDLDERNPYCATVYLGRSSEQYNGEAPTAPLAVCIAALRARHIHAKQK